MIKNKVINWAIKQFDPLEKFSIEDDLLKYFILAGLPSTISPILNNVKVESIFSKIKLCTDPKVCRSENNFISSQPLNSDKIPYPGSIEDDENAFTEEEYKKALMDDDLALIFLEKYGSFSSITDEKNNLFFSYFETVKSAAAIYSCLETGENENPFLLVAADFSGIQNFIYTISSKGALKTLRARSFFLEILAEHLLSEILPLASCKRYNILFSGGGCFSLLLPNKNEFKRKIFDFKNNINAWLHEITDGSLYFALDTLNFSESDLMSNFNFQWNKLTNQIEDDKKRKFKELLSEDLFEPSLPLQLRNEDECQICHRDDITDEFRKIGKGTNTLNVCEFCYNLYNFGDELTSFKFIFRSNRPPRNKFYLKFPNLNNQETFYFVDNKITIKSFEKIYLKNSWDILLTKDKKICPFLISDYVRSIADLPEKAKKVEKEEWDKTHNGELNPQLELKITATFSGLANSACGADLIGALRMDVDNLGLIFSKGFGKYFNIVTLSTLSRQLNIFFKVYINNICSANVQLLNGQNAFDFIEKDYLRRGGRNVSIIYSGGDDLFIVGAWDEISELSYDIYRCFRTFTCHNDDIGISGGLSLHYSKFPLYQIANISNEAEKVAKLNFDDSHKYRYRKASISFYYNRYQKEQKRLIKKEVAKQHDMKIIDPTDEGDRLALCLKWIDFDKYIIDVLRWFEPFIQKEHTQIKFKNNFPQNFSFKLLELIEDWQERGKLHLVNLIWLLQKNIMLFDELAEPVEHQVKLIKMFRDENIKHLHIPLIWIEYLKRGGH